MAKSFNVTANVAAPGTVDLNGPHTVEAINLTKAGDAAAVLSFYDAGTFPAAPSAGPTLALGAAGNPNGAYKYMVTFVTDFGESAVSPETTVTAVNQHVSLSAIPVGPAGVIARKLYRTVAAGGTNAEKLLATIQDNVTTTYDDNIGDGSLGATVTTTANLTITPFFQLTGAITGSFIQGLSGKVLTSGLTHVLASTTAPAAEVLYQ